ncbi:PREDICTED: uncharacterized protein LOC104813984 [Tarenaya hassleriana]|uniref:uncharacterized protein LOC104813984 n=1 Tax=Tarenaya hassleriana TaxID=28532 RepID=UPI0008FD7DA8|nr:PREDICTED: uncharacterized protein LOC104813984 [Tarenaya hassleriana]
MDAYTAIVIILCASVMVINVVSCCFTCFSILFSSIAERNQNPSDLRRKLLDPKKDFVDEKVITDTSKEGLVSTAIDGACGEDCGHEICAC